MTNEQLVIRIKAGENVGDNMSLLYEQMKGFIYAIARRYQAYEDIQDLEQEGFLALYDAIDGYDPERGVLFTTYAADWIMQRISRYISNASGSLRLPVYAQERVKLYKKVRHEYQRDHGRQPTIEEISAQMGLSIEQVEKTMKDAVRGNVASLDSPVGEDGEDTLQDIVAGGDNIEECVCDQVELEQLRETLWPMVDTLPGECPQVIRLRYQNGMTLNMISKLYGVTIEAIRQTERKAMRELRYPRRMRILRPFLDEESRIRSRALRGNGAMRFSQTWTSSTERIAMELAE